MKPLITFSLHFSLGFFTLLYASPHSLYEGPATIKSTEDTVSPSTSTSMIAYRYLFRGHSERRCRLHPTCSAFTLKAIGEKGLFKGLLQGIARSEIAHDAQFGFLKSDIASDGHFIYHDPLSNWSDEK